VEDQRSSNRYAAHEVRISLGIHHQRPWQL